MNRLSVYRDQDLVGRLGLDADGRLVFEYERGWILNAGSAGGGFPISLSLPLQESPFERDRARPFFANLLPEGEIRRLLTAKLGISAGNDYKLLEAIGGDCAGALSVLPEGSSPAKEGRYRPLPAAELDRIIEGMPRRPLLIAEEGVRLSLAGAQNKLPVYCEGDEFFLPEGSFASSHILKPQIPHVEDSALNEAYCMTLARRIGLPVPPVLLKDTGKKRYCLVKRFDRVVRPRPAKPDLRAQVGGRIPVLHPEPPIGRVVRLHQEDFCQALGRMPDRKYENEGGPGFKDCFQILESRSRQPAADKKALIQWAIFNFLIGNADAHAKNIALLISEEGIRLAPFYDLMSITIYPEFSAKLAMKIGGEYDKGKIFRRHWERFAEAAGVKQNFVIGILKEMGTALPVQAEEEFVRFTQLFPGKNRVVFEIVQIIKESCDSVRI